MRINGRPQQSCSALVDKLRQPITLEPMDKFPLVRDLMVDRQRMFDALRRVNRDVVDPEAHGGKVAYDVGAAYFAALEAAGLPWAEMPPEWQSHYRHFGGLTWLGARGDGVALRRRAKQFVKLATVRRHLARARRGQAPRRGPGGRPSLTFAPTHHNKAALAAGPL